MNLYGSPEGGSVLPPTDPIGLAHSSLLSEMRGWVRDLFFAIGTAIIIVVFFYQPVKVEGTSMLPELVDQERIFVNKFRYRFDRVERGDIVVFWYPLDRTKSYIKRVVGLPGDVVSVHNGSVLVNGEPLNENYVPANFFDRRSFSPISIETGHYYVLGDNRNQSNDSRMWGLVPKQNIYGKAVFRYWPVNKIGSID